jgi:cytochrome c556
MKLRELLLSVVLLAFASGGVLAAEADKAKKQAEIRKATQASWSGSTRPSPG